MWVRIPGEIINVFVSSAGEILQPTGAPTIFPRGQAGWNKKA
jgi:hypothetical protein